MKDRKRAVWWADLFYSHCKCLSAGFNTDPNVPRCPRLALGAALHSGMLLRVKKRVYLLKHARVLLGFLCRGSFFLHSVSFWLFLLSLATCLTVFACLRLFAFRERLCVSAYLWWTFSQSPLFVFDFSLLSSFFFSVRAVIRCNAVHCNSSLTPPPHPPLAPSSTPLIMVLWGSAVVETWSPGVSGVALLSPKPVVDHV